MNILIKTSKGVKCPECNGTDIKHDKTHEQYYCNKCGLVCRDKTIISPTTYNLLSKERALIYEIHNIKPVQKTKPKTYTNLINFVKKQGKI